MAESLKELAEVEYWVWLVIAPIMLTQSTWLFIDARKRKRYPWFWGLWGLIQFPLPLLFYWLLVRRKRKVK
ncbi:negative regulatory protein YxlD [Paenibacillus cisolokensis]|uniref:Negative regulatory protein YxlD n=1 Tax=Paenibacillus cisolokensis TaxID=1658519 RepID=A0ABQ4N954_9BACL|nr:negative regulatory protein YxlD [Paenibacillus cisolokensis]